MGFLTDQLGLKKNINTQSILNTTKMPNDNEKRNYNTGISDGIKKF